MAIGFPVVRVSGAPYERGVQYGEQARAEIEICRDAYEKIYQRKLGLDWSGAVDRARIYYPAAAAAFPEFIDEMRGIADGAGLQFDEIFAINCRTELIFGGTTGPSNGECTAFAIPGSMTTSGSMLMGQNWDWLSHGFTSTIQLEVHREDGPDYVTIVEAGLLAKVVMNSAGVGLATNAIVTNRDTGEPGGVPYHLILRALADSTNAADGLRIIASHQRASSCNFVLGDSGGAIYNIEAVAGGPEGLAVTAIVDHAHVHSNHLLSHIEGVTDLAAIGMSDSYLRYEIVNRALNAHPVVSVDLLESVLKDHQNFPNSVCCHIEHEDEEWATVLSAVMDLREGQIYLKAGRPCTTDSVRIDLADLLVH